MQGLQMPNKKTGTQEGGQENKNPRGKGTGNRTDSQGHAQDKFGCPKNNY